MKRQAENFHVVVGMTRLIKMPSYWFGDVLAVVFHIQKMFAETISQPSSCFADVKLVTGGANSSRNSFGKKTLKHAIENIFYSL